MKVLIENNIFREEMVNLIGVLKNLKIDYCIWDSRNSYPPYKDTDNKVFFYGSIQTAARLKKSGYRYQIWLGPEFDYSYFGAYFDKKLLNNDFYILPLNIIANFNFISYFLRSNSGFKIMNGGVYTQETLKPYVSELPKTELVVVSVPKTVGPEYRLLISATSEEFSDGAPYNIVDITQYNGEPNNYNLSILKEYVQSNILDPNLGYHPYPMWVLDIMVRSYENMDIKVVETNSINTSGLYDIDYSKFLVELQRLFREDVYA